MPTYEYQCASCDATFDIFQSIKAAHLRKAKCEACGGMQPVRRLIGTGGGILFKGSGFYQTDYRSEGYKKAAKAEKDAPSASGTDGCISIICFMGRCGYKPCLKKTQYLIRGQSLF